MKKKIAEIIESKKFIYLIQTLIIFSVLSFSIETLPDVNRKVKLFLSYTETIIVIIFSSVILFIGIGIVSVPARLLASTLTNSKK